MALFSQPVFINLPTTDTERIREFWTTLGATAMDDYSDEHSVCIELTESTYAMYLSPGYYTDFIGNREIADLSLIHISEPTRRHHVSRMPSSA